MKRNALAAVVLLMGVLLTACGQADGAQGVDMVPDIPVDRDESSMASGIMASGMDVSATGDMSMDDLKAAGMLDTEEGAVEGDVLLSDKILKTGDTMQVIYPDNEGRLYQGLEIMLHGAKVYDSPEAAGLDRAQMKEKTENYDTAGDPEWCGIDEGRILVCDLTVKNVKAGSEGELHIGEFMIAYADPDTQKVTIVSNGPAYFSASISQAGASDYYHYQLPEGESKDIKAAWLIQKEYEADNLYLCVTYDNREPEERQYFRMAEAQ